MENLLSVYFIDFEYGKALFLTKCEDDEEKIKNRFRDLGNECFGLRKSMGEIIIIKKSEIDFDLLDLLEKGSNYDSTFDDLIIHGWVSISVGVYNFDANGFGCSPRVKEEIRDGFPKNYNRIYWNYDIGEEDRVSKIREESIEKLTNKLVNFFTKR